MLTAQRRLADHRGRRVAVLTTVVVGGAAVLAGVWATTFLYDAVAGRDGISRLDRPGCTARCASGSPWWTVPPRDAIPPSEHSPSFPSVHTPNVTTVAGTLAYLLMLRQD